MIKDHIIEQIELYYQQYLQYQSDFLFNTYTDAFMSKIEGISCCRDLIEKLKKKYPITDNEICEIDNNAYSEIIVNRNYEYLISYHLHWYTYKHLRENEAAFYYKEAFWLSIRDKGDELDMLLFKTDFIRPIIDYLICQINSENYIVYLLERYKERMERFGTIDNFSGISETELSDRELNLQKQLALYLFDQGIEFYHSPKTENGEIDFLFPSYNNQAFIVEVKVYRNDQGITRLKNGISQIRSYMAQYSSDRGCLYIFTKEDVNFILNNECIKVITIYIGEKKPSERRTKRIELQATFNNK